MLAILAVSKVMLVTCKCALCFQGVLAKIILLCLGPVRGRDAAAFATRSVILPVTRGVRQ